MTLGEMLDMKAGRFVSAADISDLPSKESPYPCYGGNGVRGYVSTFSEQGERVFIGRQGALCGNVQRAVGKTYATEHAVVTVPKRTDVNIGWVFHLLTQMNLNQYASKSAQPGLAVGNLERLVVPVPSLAEQERIAAILDELDALVNNISVGLPAELAARRKQYEYYRDKLLTFREMSRS